MTGQIEKKIFQVGLADLHPVQSRGMRSEVAQAGVYVVGLDLDDAERVDDAVLERSQVAMEITCREFDDRVLVVPPKQVVGRALEDPRSFAWPADRGRWSVRRGTRGGGC